MNKFKAFFNKLKALANKAGTAIANVAKSAKKAIIANKVKSIVIGSVAILAVGGGVTTIMLVGNNGHNHKPLAAVTENYIAPTCKTSGSYEEVIYCADCGEEISRSAKTIANLTTHTPTDWITDKAATCKVKGEKHKECTVCNQVLETGTIDLIDHTEVIDSAIDPTCTQTGLSEGKHCSVCNDVIVHQQLVAAKGHTDENNDFVCDVCETELCTNHTEATIPAVKPTCTTNGLTEGKKCSVCGDILVPQTTVAASGHTNGDTVIENNVAPDCETGGSYDKVVYCSECNTELARETITVDKLGHNYNSTFVPPTATEDGYTEHHCPACEDTYKDSYVTPTEFEITYDNKSMFGYTGAENENIVIPAVFEDNGTWYRVTSIRSMTFYFCKGLTSVIIPNSVKSIGGFAFCGCSSLTTLTIPSSVTSIGERAFAGCTGITNITIDDNNPSYKSIDGNLYSKDGKTLISYAAGKTKTSFTIPDGVTSIAEEALSSCNNLESVTIPNSVTSIGNSAFAYSIGLAHVTFSPNSQLTTIETGAFNYCIRLTNIEIPDSVTSIGSEAFSECTRLQYVIFGTNSRLERIEMRTFYNCTSLSMVTLPDGITSIGTYAFNRCASLAEVTFGTNSRLASIGDHAFDSCTRLTSITIPNSVTSIGYLVFFGCTGLAEVTFGENSQLTGISDGMFNGCTNLASIAIPNSATSIGSHAFYNCSRLTAVTFSENSQLTEIGYSAFLNCTSLNNVTIPSNVTSIGSNAFDGCTSLANVTLKDNITCIGKDAFHNTALYNNPANWENDVLYINKYLISAKSMLSGTYTIKNGTPFIADSAFAGCKYLTEVMIPNSVTYIGKGAFDFCNSLTSVTIPDSVTTIGDYAFNGCIDLVSVTIGSNVTNIGDWAFSGCYKLVEVINKSSLNITVGSEENGCVGCYAFEVHSGESKIVKVDTFLFYTYNGVNYLLGDTRTDKDVTRLILPESYNNQSYEICKYAFFGYYNLTSVTIPNGVTNIGYGAFDGCGRLVEVIDKSSLNIASGSMYDSCINYNALEIHSGESKIVNVDNYLFYTVGGTNYLIGYVGTATELTLPTNYNNQSYVINSYAFYGLENITSVTIPDSVTEIGYYAFYDTALYNNPANWENNVLYIGKYLIKANETLSGYYTIKDGTLCIADFAFENCNDLYKVTIPNSITRIGVAVFYNCSFLENVTIPNSIISIGDCAFFGCHLAGVTIPDSVTHIGREAFYCGNLASAYFEDSSTWYYTKSYSDWLNKTGGTRISITNADTNAHYLKSLYSGYYWYKL